MRGDQLLQKMAAADKPWSPQRSLVYLGDIPKSLRSDLKPDRHLYFTEEDAEEAQQHIWLSTKGVKTHTHFDSDHNIFVQLVGRKKWTLYPPSAALNLCPYPRVHPMWHKSRLHFGHIDSSDRWCPTSAEGLNATEVVLGPGDVLYVPPLYWHHVESLDSSASLTTYSRALGLSDRLHAVYGHELQIDKEYNKSLPFPQPQGYILRIFLDLLVRALYIEKGGRLFAGHPIKTPSDFFELLVKSRFLGLEKTFPVDPERDSAFCLDDLGLTPMARFMHGEVVLDKEIVKGHFMDFPPAVRDTLFADYVEQVTEQVVGPHKIVAYFLLCFQGSRYRIAPGDMWTQIQSPRLLPQKRVGKPSRIHTAA